MIAIYRPFAQNWMLLQTFLHWPIRDLKQHDAGKKERRPNF